MDLVLNDYRNLISQYISYLNLNYKSTKSKHYFHVQIKTFINKICKVKLKMKPESCFILLKLI